MCFKCLLEREVTNTSGSKFYGHYQHSGDGLVLFPWGIELFLNLNSFMSQ